MALFMLVEDVYEKRKLKREEKKRGNQNVPLSVRVFSRVPAAERLTYMTDLFFSASELDELAKSLQERDVRTVGLLLHGDPGAGKSFLAGILLDAMEKRGVSVYQRASRFYDEMPLDTKMLLFDEAFLNTNDTEGDELVKVMGTKHFKPAIADARRIGTTFSHIKLVVATTNLTPEDVFALDERLRRRFNTIVKVNRGKLSVESNLIYQQASSSRIGYVPLQGLLQIVSMTLSLQQRISYVLEKTSGVISGKGGLEISFSTSETQTETLTDDPEPVATEQRLDGTPSTSVSTLNSEGLEPNSVLSKRAKRNKRRKENIKKRKAAEAEAQGIKRD